MPHVNSFYSFHSKKKAEDIYPCDTKCRITGSHSKWHEEAANGLVYLAYGSFRVDQGTSSDKVLSVTDYVSAMLLCVLFVCLMLIPLLSITTFCAYTERL